MASFIPSTPEERLEMLKAVGLNDYRELYKDVPAEMYLEYGALNIPEGLSELEVSRKVSAMAAKNRVFPTVLRGAGAYDHYIPSIVKYIPAKEEFLTAYTPYQAEMSQGILQSIFEYQTDICELTGMDIYFEGRHVGWVTSGTMVPYYEFDKDGNITENTGKRSIGFAYVDSDVTKKDIIEIDVRGRRLKAKGVIKHLNQSEPPYAKAVLPKEK